MQAKNKKIGMEKNERKKRYLCVVLKVLKYIPRIISFY